MSKLWVAPRVWAKAERMTSVKMQEVSNALEWLKDRPYAVARVTGQGANITQACTGNTNFFAANDTLYALSLTTAVANEKVLVMFRSHWSTSGAIASQMNWDVLLDDTNYLSSGTATPTPGGIHHLSSVGAAAVIQPFFCWGIFTIPTAGIHTLKLRIAGTNATTITLYQASTNVVDFVALDI